MNIKDVEFNFPTNHEPPTNYLYGNETELNIPFKHLKRLRSGLEADGKEDHVWTIIVNEQVEAELEELFREARGEDMPDFFRTSEGI